MKKILLALALTLAAAAPAAALDASQLGAWSCSVDGFGNRHCAPNDGLDARSKKLKSQREYETKLLPALKKEGYPRSIVFTDPEQYRIGKLGWNTRRDCNRLKAGEYNEEAKVNTFKVIYCVSKKAGYPIPKPEIKKGW